MGTGNEELYRVDPTSNQVVAMTDLHSRPRSLAAGEGSVWVFNSGDGTVDQIDSTTCKRLATIETGAAERGAITVGGGG
jgi:virginiamycin B lyase